MNSYELHKSNSQIYTLLFLNSKCVYNRHSSTPHWLVTITRTSKQPAVLCLSITAVAALGLGYTRNTAAGEESAL